MIGVYIPILKGTFYTPILQVIDTELRANGQHMMVAFGSGVGDARRQAMEGIEFLLERGCDGLIHLAAHRSPMSHADHVVFNENSAGNYNALSAAATVGIKRVCLASSINAIGGVFSRQPRYDYFPLDEQHPCYAEDPYSLSKWVGEQQADAFARRFEDMSIASMRFHGLIDTRERALERAARYPMFGWRDLWAYTLLSEAARACLLALTADFKGHEAFYIVAPLTAKTTPSADLAHEHFPGTPFRSELPGTQGFFSCAKAERILGWVHTAE